MTANRMFHEPHEKQNAGVRVWRTKKDTNNSREGANTEAKKKNLDMNTKREIPEKRKG